MTFKEFQKESGMTLTEISEYFEIPYRTVQNWAYGQRKCPEYLLKLMAFKIDTERSRD